MRGKDWFALVLILLGVLLLGDNLGLFRFDYIFRLWPVALIIVGLSMFIKKDEGNRKKNVVEVSFSTSRPAEPATKVEPEADKNKEDDEDDDEI